MCAILDNSARDEVFGTTPTDRGLRFLKWINEGRSRLALGGRLENELKGGGVQPGSNEFNNWLATAEASGRVIRPNGDVEAETRSIESATDYRGRRVCESDDPHVLALAKLTGARLLFSRDDALIQDFQNNRILNQPRGKVYPHENFNEFLNHRRNRNLCSGYRSN